MKETITLHEYKNWTGDLGAEDANFISSRLAKKISIRREQRGNALAYVLNPQQWIGVVSLPSGRRLESQTKVPTRNMFYMLAVALEFDFKAYEFWDEVARFERVDEILEFVAVYFADLVDEKIKHGLHGEYVEHEENLPAVRGRVDFAQDVRHNYILRHRMYCRFADFTWDIAENQIIRQVAHMLASWGFRCELRTRLGQIDAALSEVTPTNLPAHILNGFRYHRANEDYLPIHRLCRLFLEGASFHEDIGALEFRTFLIDTNKLFEQFVTQVLITNTQPGARINAQYPIYMDDGQKIKMRPDIVIYQCGNPISVADCKYKRNEPDEYKNHDVYQLLAYCTALPVSRGLLIYPRWEGDRLDEFSVTHTQISIRHVTIDLGRVGRDFVEECADFAKKVFKWSCEQPKVSSTITDNLRIGTAVKKAII